MSYVKNDQYQVFEYDAIHRAFFENNPMPMWIHDADSQRFIGVNRAALEKYGYSREEFLKKTINDVHPPEEPERTDPELQAAIDKPKVHRHRLKSGRLIAVETTSHELEYDGHKAVFTIIHDIADQGRIKDRTREEGVLSHDIIEAVPFGYYRIVQDGFFSEVNSAFAGMLGYTRQELLSIDAPEELSFDSSEPELRETSRGFSSEPEIYSLKSKNGAEVRIEDFSRYVRDQEGEIIYREGICRQIMDHGAAEPKFFRGEEVSPLLVERLPIAILLHADSKIVYANPAAMKLAAAGSVGQLLGRSVLEFIHPDSQTIALAHVSLILNGEKDPRSSELKFVRVDGATETVQVTSVPITYHGKPLIQSAIQDISEQKKFERRLHLQDAALNAVANAIAITDQKGKIEWVNPAFEKLTGYAPFQAVGADISKLVRSGKQDVDFYKKMWDTVLSGKAWHGQLVNRRKDGTLYDEDMTITPVSNDEETHFIAIMEDLTERKTLEDELTQAQKLDVIGRLAGGVAHDYNNVLGVILGYGELIKNKLRDEESIRRQLDAIIAAAKRGSELTKRLLSFSRKEIVSPKIISVNSSIESIKEMLLQVIGENRNLVLNLGRDIWNARVDPTQLDQVLVNLATNARDAIENVGTITIETANMLADEVFVRGHSDFTQGEYVRISFADSGKGMDKNILKKIFEPFFTTKPIGKGTGLGLAMVHAIVKQNNGNIEVQSEPGVGTRFDVYFPRFDGESEKVREQTFDGTLKGNATVLVVEDRVDLLELARKGLEEYGYKVLTATNPQEALLLCRGFSGDIDLLLADVVMPTMNGGELSRRIRKIKPDIQTLFMSGYTADVLAPQDAAGKRIAFIQKPFTPQALAKKLQEVLAKT
jgi:PAS domain S-box-containing protein